MKFAIPCTEKREPGVVVPMPTFPPYGLSNNLLWSPEATVKLPDAELIGPPKVVVAVELKVLAPETVRALLTVRLAAERAVVAPHWKTAPYMVMALLLAVRMRYFIEVPLGWVETSMLESPYRVVPSSKGVPIITRVLVAHVVPPSLDTAAIRSVLRVKDADEYA